MLLAEGVPDERRDHGEHPRQDVLIHRGPLADGRVDQEAPVEADEEQVVRRRPVWIPLPTEVPRNPAGQEEEASPCTDQSGPH